MTLSKQVLQFCLCFKEKESAHLHYQKAELPVVLIGTTSNINKAIQKREQINVFFLKKGERTRDGKF